MKTELFVYTGTGNSLWIARQLAVGLEDTAIKFMPFLSGEFEVNADRIGIIFPVHIWGLPRRVIRFINHLKTKPETYFFAVAVNAGQVAATLLQLQKLMSAQKKQLSLGYSISLPSNYIPWGGPGPVDTQQRLFKNAQDKVKSIAHAILRGERQKVDRGPLWQNILFSRIYKMSFRQVPKMDKKFWTDDKCNGCEICFKVCPAENIEMKNEKPSWLHQCEQCLACIQWCPQEAIQYGKKTVKYRRYHHPEVTLQNMLEQANAS
ncbi:MAG: 4Fe-4S dicluster domain-containing protein [Deltaproteobacteria bacterium]|nr:4Fe-4S dicluster domain-containing protein [Deltaproteobacteria bacterium]